MQHRMGGIRNRLISSSTGGGGGNTERMPRLTLVLLLMVSCVLMLQLSGYNSCVRHSTEHQHPAAAAAAEPTAAVHTLQAGRLLGNATSSKAIAAETLAALGPPPYRFPKLIHQTVKDKSRLSCEEKRVIDSWKRLNPGYTHKLWDDEEMRAFVVEHYPELVPVPYDVLLTGTERSDVWRVLVLHKYGGVYADMDVECMRPIDEWNADHNHDAAVLVGLEHLEPKRMPHHIHVNNWAVAAMPGHPMLSLFPAVVTREIQKQFFALARQEGMLSLEQYEKGVIDRTGPAALTTALYEHFSSHGVDLNAFSQADVNSKEGVVAGSVRVMPVVALSSAWEVAAARQRGERLSCADLAKRHPQALVCHMFWGSWRSNWGFRQQLTYGDCD